MCHYELLDIAFFSEFFPKYFASQLPTVAIATVKGKGNVVSGALKPIILFSFMHYLLTQ
jgi:hypothetical protein